MTASETHQAIQTIWEYHHMHHALKPAEVMLVLGSHDLGVAVYAAELFERGLAPLVLVTGGIAHEDDLLKTDWLGSEAEKFAEVMMGRGVPADKIMLENQARNTGDNFTFSKALLDDRGIKFTRALVVTKPYMERRAYATGAKQWPDKEILVTSPDMSFDEYVSGDLDRYDVINIMMGDLQRIEVYGRKGFQIVQEIPEEVKEAFRVLKDAGYTKHLLEE